MSAVATRTNSAVMMTILLVADPSASGQFYQQLFGLEPVESSPTFVMFALPSGNRLGLWSAQTVQPTPGGSPGASELCVIDQDVDALYASWLDLGVRFAQAPTDMDFGRTFVALDPDGHRLRVFRPMEEEANV